jgi:uncharacterized protein (TIGR00251 family)
MSETWLRVAADGSLVLTVHVQPNAKRTEFAGAHGEAMKLRLAAPPVDGKANAALVAFVAAYCGVGRAAVTLLSGETSRAKRLRVEGADEAALQRLRALG